MIRTRPVPAPPGYVDVIVSGPLGEVYAARDELELTDGVVGFSPRVLTADGGVAVKVRFRDDAFGGLVLHQLTVGDRLPAVRTRAASVEARPDPPLRAYAEIGRRPVPGTVAYRAANPPWWQDRQKVVLGGLAVGVVLGVIGLVLWALVSAVQAGARAVAEHGVAILGVLFLAGVGLLVFKLAGRSGGGCGGLHCSGCSRH